MAEIEVAEMSDGCRLKDPAIELSSANCKTSNLVYSPPQETLDFGFDRRLDGDPEVAGIFGNCVGLT